MRWAVDAQHRHEGQADRLEGAANESQYLKSTESQVEDDGGGHRHLPPVVPWPCTRSTSRPWV